MSDTKQHRIIIAIDGFSSCGKSTFAKAIAARLGYIFIDTGAMYRAVSPLRQAPDAVVLDNSRMSVEEQMAWFMELFERRIAE